MFKGSKFVCNLVAMAALGVAGGWVNSQAQTGKTQKAVAHEAPAFGATYELHLGEFVYQELLTWQNRANAYLEACHPGTKEVTFAIITRSGNSESSRNVRVTEKNSFVLPGRKAGSFRRVTVETISGCTATIIIGGEYP